MTQVHPSGPKMTQPSLTRKSPSSEPLYLTVPLLTTSMSPPSKTLLTSVTNLNDGLLLRQSSSTLLPSLTDGLSVLSQSLVLVTSILQTKTQAAIKYHLSLVLPKLAVLTPLLMLPMSTLLTEPNKKEMSRLVFHTILSNLSITKERLLPFMALTCLCSILI
jgi:hypothetical protein